MNGDFPREPVPEEAANRPAKAIAMIIANAIMGVPIMILGVSIGRDYGTHQAWLVVFLGCTITALFAALVAHTGVKSRRSTALLAREALGLSGAHLLNLAIATALLGWFAVELGFIGGMVSDGAQNVFHATIGAHPGIIVATLLTCTITISGISLISRAPVLFLPLLGGLLLIVLFLTLQAPGLHVVGHDSPKSIGTGISAIVGGSIIGCLIMPDYSRFVRTSRSAAGASMIALGPVYGLVLGTYAIAGLVTHQSQPTAILLSLGLPAVIGFMLPVGLLQNCIMSLYSSSLAISTLIKPLSLKSITISSTVLGTALALVGADAYFVKFLVVLGIVFPPAAALIIYVGLFCSPSSEPNTALWNWLNMAAWGFGIACGVSSEWLGIGLTGFSAFDGFVGTAFGATVLHLMRKKGGFRIAD